jgi:hypothetical protein
VGSAYDVGPDRPAPVGGERCRRRGAHARDRTRLGEVFVGPDTTVFRVEGSQLLQVFSAYLGIDTTTTTGSCPAAMHYRRAVGSWHVGRHNPCDRLPALNASLGPTATRHTTPRVRR